MFFEKQITQLDAMEAVHAASETLKRIDSRLVDHGERVAHIACELCRAGNLDVDIKSLFLLSIFHDVGAYKTDEIDRMVEFETQDVWSHSIYGYLFLKYMTPLDNVSEAILYHHSPWQGLNNLPQDIKQYAALIHLADRIDIALSHGAESEYVKDLWDNKNCLFNDYYVSLFHECLQNRRLYEDITSGAYRDANIRKIHSFNVTANEALAYLKMLVYSIDFRSEHTVTHTINTISIALNIAKHFNISLEEQENIYLGALLHDVGKVAIPVEILEYPGRLSDEQMKIMRTHVQETELLICNVIPDYICQIAVRHHEKLDGSGYPHNLRAEDLNFSQRIVAVADIVSALNSRRSYKDSFPKEKTLAILHEMAVSQLDPTICNYICEYFDTIMESTEKERSEIINRYTAMSKEYDLLKATMAI